MGAGRIHLRSVATGRAARDRRRVEGVDASTRDRGPVTCTSRSRPGLVEWRRACSAAAPPSRRGALRPGSRPRASASARGSSAGRAGRCPGRALIRGSPAGGGDRRKHRRRPSRRPRQALLTESAPPRGRGGERRDVVAEPRNGTVSPRPAARERGIVALAAWPLADQPTTGRAAAAAGRELEKEVGFSPARDGRRRGMTGARVLRRASRGGTHGRRCRCDVLHAEPRPGPGGDVVEVLAALRGRRAPSRQPAIRRHEPPAPASAGARGMEAVCGVVDRDRASRWPPADRDRDRVVRVNDGVGSGAAERRRRAECTRPRESTRDVERGVVAPRGRTRASCGPAPADEIVLNCCAGHGSTRFRRK